MDRPTMGIKQTKFSGIEIGLLVFLGIAEFLGLAEWIAAFIRNSHILGFWFGAVLFIMTAITLTLMILWVRKGAFIDQKRMIIFGLTAFWALLLCFVICFLTVKIINYSQPNTNLDDLGYHDRFSADCVEQVQKCSRITVQSRNEHTAIIKVSDQLPWQGDSFYVQTSHTDVFLGLIVDGVYSMAPYVPQMEIKAAKIVWTGLTPYTDSWTFVTWTKRIGAKDTDWDDFESK